MSKIKLTLLCLLGLYGPLATAAIWKVTYPRPITEFDQRTDFPVKLLSLALDQTGVKYRLIPSDKVLTPDRSIRQLIENREINVLWSMTNVEREQNMLPIRIPIYKGLIGWRMFLINNKLAPAFRKIQNLQQLTKLKPIQVLSWPDTKILQSNGFDVITPKGYQEIFTFLNRNQGDFLPRSIIEIWSEMKTDAVGEDVIIEPTLGVRYPVAMYFFVNRNDKILAKLLTDGIESAIEKGEFDMLFNLEFNDELKQAKLEDRFFYELDNPSLPPKTPLDRKELWYK